MSGTGVTMISRDGSRILVPMSWTGNLIESAVRSRRFCCESDMVQSRQYLLTHSFARKQGRSTTFQIPENWSAEYEKANECLCDVAVARRSEAVVTNK